MSKIIPNSFQTPNAYVDEYLAYLTPEEFVVLIYMDRRIFGFHKGQDRISLSQFEQGIKTSKGKILDEGTGLSRKTILKALGELKEFGLIRQVAPNNPPTNDGACYELQFDEMLIDLEGLKARRDKQLRKNRTRTKRGRLMSLRNRHVTGGVSDTPHSGE